MSNFALKISLPLVALCVFWISVNATRSDDMVIANDFFYIRFSMRPKCSNSYNEHSSYDNWKDKTPSFHNHHVFRMWALRTAEHRKWLVINDTLPYFDFNQHKHKFPGAGLDITYEFMHPAPQVCEKPYTACERIDYLVFEIPKGAKAWFMYDSVEIYTPVAGPFKFEIEETGCPCKQFVRFSCKKATNSEGNFALVFNKTGIVGQLEVNNGSSVESTIKSNDNRKRALKWNTEWCSDDEQCTE
ncbi:hypothetical protein QR680_008190 [Steinernema hermaphroditum]|uniref:Uncharacterized protein n=1 Tax=Steinernema hermaphroditum TaxID=289476 RepID=A0AA39M7P0_9BILA|nr:hypothetical protein QR680_008190 [Steinernema hermaphroditum]